MGAFTVKQDGQTAREAALVSCHVCHLLCGGWSQTPGITQICPRCGATLHQRKPNSIRRTWALILAAYILYIPANLLPITSITHFGKIQTDTIISGVIYFIVSGMWPIALIIFVASVLVPLLKLMILTFLLIVVGRKSNCLPDDCTRLYRFTEAVGRWSMVDIYVVTVLAALVNLGAIAKIEAGPAAVFFAAVVVITLFAAESFDPRLIWDKKEHIDE
jgi:paraquat-inducible protein A